jgi:hypothetical protein
MKRLLLRMTVIEEKERSLLSPSLEIMPKDHLSWYVSCKCRQLTLKYDNAFIYRDIQGVQIKTTSTTSAQYFAAFIGQVASLNQTPRTYVARKKFLLNTLYLIPGKKNMTLERKSK